MVARTLRERSADVDAVVILDAAGALLEASDGAGRGRELGELARELVERADASADEPVAELEVQTGAGAVYAVRDPAHVVACVTRRGALSSLVLFDLRRALAGLER